MIHLNSLKNIGIPLSILIYLIFPYPAITKTTKVNFKSNLEKALNSSDLEFIKKSFSNDRSQKVLEKFSKISKDFPDTKWKINKLKSFQANKENYQIKVVGAKNVDKERYIIESNFNFLFSLVDGKINEGTIKKLFTIVRSDDKKIDISFRIPDKVLTGSKYDMDIILNEPLKEVIIAGGIKPHQIDSFFEQDIDLEPLVSGGIFKVTRAPAKPGTQIWSGIIVHPEGMITFTKSVDVVEKI